MKTNNRIEREIDKIRLEIYIETKHMTLKQRDERLEKNVDAAQKEFVFKRVDNGNENPL